MTPEAPEGARHTPGPWTHRDSGTGKVYVEGPGTRVARWLVAEVDGRMHAENVANAAFIVRAANAHDDLLEALRPFANYACESSCEYDPSPCHNCIARDAIAKAEAP